MLRKFSILAVLCTVSLFAIPTKPASAILCPHLPPRCCATGVGPNGCPVCTCLAPADCC